jgi:beta-lactamase class D
MITLLAVLLLSTWGVQAADEATLKAVATELEGLDAGFVMLNLETDEYFRYKPERCAERLSPCSTFKIPHSLFALECGVLQDENTVIKWDGKKRDRETWNQDQTLATAVKYSAVWYFQEVAGRIGEERMRDFLAKIGYGNQDISGGLKRFWLGSSLTISADEQVEFLAKLVRRELPFAQRNMDIVVKILKQDDVPGEFYGKTGSGRLADDTHIGWFVGFVEKDGSRRVFALSLKGGKGVNGFLARDKAVAIFSGLGFIPSK